MGECGQVFSMELSFRYLKRQNLGKVCTKELSVHWSSKAKNFVTIEVAFADFSSFSKPLLLPKISVGPVKLKILLGVQTPAVNFLIFQTFHVTSLQGTKKGNEKVLLTCFQYLE